MSGTRSANPDSRLKHGAERVIMADQPRNLGKRIYPSSRLAAAVVWFLDRLPEDTRSAVLAAYWSPEDIRTISERASDLDEFFGSGPEIGEQK